MAVCAQTVYDSSYVEFAPDGRAWTTDRGKTDYEWYPEGTAVFTGISSSLRALNRGEHYYANMRSGVIPVGRWEVVYRTGNCIHRDYPAENWHGLTFRRRSCRNYYFSGWNVYCADCNEKITNMLFYMSREAAGTISYLEAGTGMAYYYLCPWCDNMEQGSGIPAHKCKAISWNQYKVHYDVNTLGMFSGYMEDSIHMYNNAAVYEGNPVTPQTRLTKNAYQRIGYEFAGWNTRPDGGGIFYGDGAEILNLTEENWRQGEQGIVTLYAMWRPCEGTLRLDPAGGIYEGRAEPTLIQGKYMDVYQIKDSVEAPLGAVLSFEVNGGIPLADITGKTHLKEWAMEPNFLGKFRQGQYVFAIPDGHMDTLRAVYEREPIVLPAAVKEGSSFGGWYYDRKLTDFAGDAGENIVIKQDSTLYAKWVTLKLQAKDNYQADGGKGAVDLSWSQPDGREKAYLLYQSLDGQQWTGVYGSHDKGEKKHIFSEFFHTGQEERYVVPYAGIYRVTAAGAQGGNFQGHQGGAGGSVSADIWLSAGDCLRILTGAQSGYGGGGKGTGFANGGGRTVVALAQEDILLTAGGGGGASALEDGAPGGSVSGLRKDRIGEGEDGAAGGGAGFVGGMAGNAILHHHTEECYREVNYEVLMDGGIYHTAYEEEYGKDENIRHILQYGDSARLIPVGEADTLEVELIQKMRYGHDFHGNDLEESFLAVYNQSGELLFYGSGNCEKYEVRKDSYYSFDDENEAVLERERLSWGFRHAPSCWIEYDENGNTQVHSNNFDYIPVAENILQTARDFGGTTYLKMGSAWFGTEGRAYVERIKIPEDTTGIYVISSVAANNFLENHFYRLRLTGARHVVCGLEEGQVISYTQAFGGSSYANEKYCRNVSEEIGIRHGNGGVTVASQTVGFLEEHTLKAVSAPDRAAPDKIAESTIRRNLTEDNRLLVSWQEPKDNGTAYYHIVESYETQNVGYRLCQSNVTRNILTSGVVGYYYMVSPDETAIVTRQNGRFQEERELVLDKADQADPKLWLHVAAVDKAGNLGETAHISLDPNRWGTKWRLYTKQLQIDQGENVFCSETGDFYVRSDGKTPITIHYSAEMNGEPYGDYWLSQAIFESREQEHVTRNIVLVEKDGETAYGAQDSSFLSVYPYTLAKRDAQGRTLDVTQQFLMDAQANGQRILMIPIAAAGQGEKINYSDHEEDEKNGIMLIGDGEAPVIRGMEVLSEIQFVAPGEAGSGLELTAEDSGSGLAEFRVEIHNHDNEIVRIVQSDSRGKLVLDLSEEDPIFSGDFTVTARARDHVGNESCISAGTMGFALDTEIRRILEPHNPVFRCGESGILSISLWGYVDRVEVEFPEELTALDPQLNQTFDYTDKPDYFREEELQFMIPLYAPEAEEFTVTVRAYKGDSCLEQYPQLSVLGVSGTVLDDIRTRLR